jgi:hypothetical protein
MPDSIESRHAALAQRVEDLALAVNSMAPLIAQHAQMDVRFGHLEEELRAIHEDVRAMKFTDEEDRKRREERETEDRRSRRVAYITGAFAIAVQMIAIIGGIITLLLTGGGS